MGRSALLCLLVLSSGLALLECRGPECESGDRVCEGLVSLQCGRNGRWIRTRCALGQTCKVGLCRAIPVFPDGSTGPDVASPRELPSGSEMSSPAEPSPPERPVERAGLPDAGPQERPSPGCTPGASRCAGDQARERCVGGLWQAQACPAGTSCVAGQCKSACTPGQKRCADAQHLETCSAGRWVKASCGARMRCEKDACVSSTPCPGGCQAGQICSQGSCISWSTRYRKCPFGGNKTDRDPPKHADLNPKLRGWRSISGESKQLVQYNGATDPNAPKLHAMFGGSFPGILNNYQAGEWDWGSNSKRGWITSTPWKVHYVGFKTSPGAALKLPSRGPDIFQGWARALVLYLDDDSITFVYTREDTVANGYAIHVNGIHLPVDLVRLYKQLASRSTKELPALENGQAFGVARGNEVRVAVRDRGAFMDPRAKKDWW